MPAIRRSMTRITSTTLCPSPNSLGSKSRTPRGSMTRRNVRSWPMSLGLLQIDKYSFTTVDGHMAISYTGHDSEDSRWSCVERSFTRPLASMASNPLELPARNTSSSSIPSKLSEDTQEWNFRHWLYLLPGDAHPGLDGSRHGGRDPVWPSSSGSSPPSSALRPISRGNDVRRSLYTDEVVDSTRSWWWTTTCPRRSTTLQGLAFLG